MLIKKIHFVALVMAGCFLFVACNPKTNANNETQNEQNQQAQEKEEKESKEDKTKYMDLFVDYTTWKLSIKIDKGKLYHTSTEYEYSNPVSGTPSDSKVHTHIDGKELSAKDLQMITEKIMESKFMSLEKNTYGADENQRYYPYMIKVKWNGQEKEVHFRSNPQAEKEPQAFKALGDALRKFVEGK